MRYYLDSEFDEDGKTIELISLAIVAEDGRELYLASNEFDPNKCNDWVKEHVLPFVPSAFDPRTMSRAQIRDKVIEFIKDDPDPQFWAYFADYDWVLFCQLWGRMLDLPEKFPKFCLDLKQLRYHKGHPKLPDHGGKQHDALDDARWNRKIYDMLAPLPWVRP